jgi:hypothetical protein
VSSVLRGESTVVGVPLLLPDRERFIRENMDEARMQGTDVGTN